MAVRIGLLQGSRGVDFLMSEVSMYVHGDDQVLRTPSPQSHTTVDYRGTLLIRKRTP